MPRGGPQFSRQEPAPRGSPQGAAAGASTDADFAETANTECCLSSAAPRQAGQAGGRDAVTSVSNC